jgi:hypothetical protein
MRVNSSRKSTRRGGGHASLLWTPQNDLDTLGGYWWDYRDIVDGTVAGWVSRCGKGQIALLAGAGPTKDANGVAFNGTTQALSRSAATNASVHLRSNTIPDSTYGMSPDGTGKGFTCTGLTVIPGTDFYWLGNHGDTSVAHDNSGPWNPSLVKVYRNPATGALTKITEIRLQPLLGVNVQSVQDVTFDTSDNTLWFAVATGTIKGVYHVTQAGVLLSDTITATWAPNGLAYDPRDDAIFINRESSDGNGLEKRSCSTGAVTMASFNPGFTAADQLYFDAATHELLLSYGTNAPPGNVAVYDAETPTTLVAAGTIAFPAQCNATEGIDRSGDRLINLNDDWFHPAGALLNQSVEVRCCPPLPKIVSVHMTALVSATTGTDCLIEFGTPLGGAGNGWGIYPTSTTALNLIVNTGASGTGQQSTVSSGAISAMTSMRMIGAIFNMTAKTVSVRLDGSAVTTGNLTNCIGSLTLAQIMRLGTSADSRFASCVIKDVAIVAGASDYQRIEGWQAWQHGLTANLPANHPYKNAAPTP